jgi:transposase
MPCSLCGKNEDGGSARERQRTDSTHVLAKIRAINRLMCVGEAMRFALNSLAVVAPDWLLGHSDGEWVERYGHRIEESRLPRSQADRLAMAELIGADGWKVLTAVFDPLAPAWLREIPALQTLRQIWVQNYSVEDEHLRWREAENIPPATLFIHSPYDPEARLGKKRSTDVGQARRCTSLKRASRPCHTSSLMLPLLLHPRQMRR